MHFVLLFIGLISINFSIAFIGYDCGQKFTNFTTISLVDIGECEINDPIIDTVKTKITLLQLNEYTNALVRYCKIEIKRTVYSCGFWSHLSSVKNAEVRYLREITRDECLRMHLHRSISISNNIIQNLSINSTVTHPVTFAGHIKASGSCENTGHYADLYGEFSDVFVQGYITIKLEERQEVINLNNNKIKLNSGTICNFNEGQCIDSNYGHAFWDFVPIRACEGNQYTNLYTGVADKIMERDSDNRPIYVLESNEISFAFKDIGRLNVCSYQLIRTEHPKLFILIDSENFQAEKYNNVNNIDIFAYINSKFVFVERHIKGQLNRLYYNILKQQCELERKIIANALSLASVAPDLLAYQIMGGPGFISLLAGEVIHILKCVPVEVATRRTEECYQELPVEREGKAYFLTPRSHILKQYGTKAVCDSIVPVQYHINNQWIKLLPTATSQDAPQILKPSSKQTWKYVNPLDIANSGIYPSRDLDKLKTYIMFPNERGAVLNQIAMGAAGKSRISGDISITRLLDEEAIKKLADSTWNKIWEKFITFGSISAGCITLLIIFRMIKSIMDIVIHGYTLHSIYGWSIHLLGALFNSITHLLLHLAKKERESDEETAPEKADYGRRSGASAILQGTATAPPDSSSQPKALTSPLCDHASTDLRRDNPPYTSAYKQHTIYPNFDELTIHSLPNNSGKIS